MPRSLLLLITSVFLGCSGGDQSGKKGGGPPTNSDSGTITRDDTGSSSTKTCATSKDCDAGLVCDRLDGACESCRVTADCGVGQRCSDGSCVVSAACNSDLDCTGDGLVCDTEAGVCVECNSAAECESGGCMHHSCVPSPACKSSLDCADYTMICGEALPPDWPASYAGSACLECMSSADCPDGASCDAGLCFDTCAQAGVICGEYYSGPRNSIQ
jgi:hypothetical protein